MLVSPLRHTNALHSSTGFPPPALNRRRVENPRTRAQIREAEVFNDVREAYEAVLDTAHTLREIEDRLFDPYSFPLAPYTTPDTSLIADFIEREQIGPYEESESLTAIGEYQTPLWQTPELPPLPSSPPSNEPSPIPSPLPSPTQPPLSLPTMAGPLKKPMPTVFDSHKPTFLAQYPDFDEFFDGVSHYAERAGLSEAETIQWAIRYARAEGDSWKSLDFMKETRQDPMTFDQF